MTSDPIFTAILEAPLYGPHQLKLTEPQARTLAFEIRAHIDLETTRFEHMERQVAEAQSWRALLSAHFPELTPNAITLTVDDAIVGWIDFTTETIGLTPKAEQTATWVIRCISSLSAEHNVTPAPLMSAPAASVDESEALQAPHLHEQLDVDGDQVWFPITVSVAKSWSTVGFQPTWMSDCVNPDI